MIIIITIILPFVFFLGYFFAHWGMRRRVRKILLNDDTPERNVNKLVTKLMKNEFLL